MRFNRSHTLFTLLCMVVATCSLTILVGCATGPPDSESSASEDSVFSSGKFRSYAWMPGRLIVTGQPEFTESEIRDLIKNEVEEYLTGHGLTLKASSRADVLIAFYVAAYDQIQASYEDALLEYVPRLSTDSRSTASDKDAGPINQIYRRGTLTLEVIDSRSGRVLQRVSIEEEFEPNASADEHRETARLAVRRLLDKLDGE